MNVATNSKCTEFYSQSFETGQQSVSLGNFLARNNRKKLMTTVCNLKSPSERGLHKRKVIPSDSVTQLTHTEQNSVHVLFYTSQMGDFSSNPNGTFHARSSLDAIIPYMTERAYKNSRESFWIPVIHRMFIIQDISIAASKNISM